MIHSLESTNFLKIDKMNCLHFEFSGEKKVITIQQQYTKKNRHYGDQTNFDTIYRININDITLRELLLL